MMLIWGCSTSHADLVLILYPHIGVVQLYTLVCWGCDLWIWPLLGSGSAMQIGLSKLLGHVYMPKWLVSCQFNVDLLFLPLNPERERVISLCMNVIAGGGGERELLYSRYNFKTWSWFFFYLLDYVTRRSEKLRFLKKILDSHVWLGSLSPGYATQVHGAGNRCISRTVKPVSETTWAQRPPLI